LYQMRRNASRNPRRKRRGPRKSAPNGNVSVAAADANGRSPAIPRGPAPTAFALLRPPVFPASVRQKGQLYYESGLGFTAPISGNAVHYFFSANGMFDPNITGTGHQPIGFDQMMLFYEQYTVMSSSIEVQFLFATGVGCRCGVTLAPDTTSITSSNELMENGLIRTSTSMVGTTSLQGLPYRKVRISCDVAKYFGRKSSGDIVNDPNLHGTIAANPTEQVYYDITAWQTNPDGSTTTSIGFDVLISFDVIYWEPRKVAPSLYSMLANMIRDGSAPSHRQGLGRPSTPPFRRSSASGMDDWLVARMDSTRLDSDEKK